MIARELATQPGKPATVAGPPAVAFDYASVPPTVADELRQRADIIRQRQARAADDFIMIGRLLFTTKVQHPGCFIAWIESELGMNERTAQGYIQCAAFAKKHPDRTREIAALPMRVLLTIAAKTTPDAARDEIFDRAIAGEHVTVEEAKSIVNQHRPAPEPQPEAEATKTIDSDAAAYARDVLFGDKTETAEPERMSSSEGRDLIKKTIADGELISGPSGPAKSPGKGKRAKSPAKPETVKERKARERAETEREYERRCAEAIALANELRALIPEELWKRIDDLKLDRTAKPKIIKVDGLGMSVIYPSYEPPCSGKARPYDVFWNRVKDGPICDEDTDDTAEASADRDHDAEELKAESSGEVVEAEIVEDKPADDHEIGELAFRDDEREAA